MIKIDDDYDEERKNSMRTMSTTTTTTRRRKKGGETTIPSVVAFVPDTDNYKDHKPLPPSQLSDDDASRSCRLQNNMESFLPPIWATMTRTRSAASTPSSLSCQDSNPSVHWPTNENYRILVGNPALQYENQFPNSTYRNVKRIIGTGGKVARMAFGVVPNLFVHDENQNHENADVLLSSKRNNRTQPNKRSKKLRRRKELEGLPKLHKQLEEARTYPALLTCDSMNGDEASASSSTREEDMLLCPEQISACILRKLYNAAENWYDHNQNQGRNDVVVRVTRAVIGVPAYFTESQRQATMLASELAGVSKVKLLPEPEAAALAYGSLSFPSTHHSDEGEELILVFDLGGGTFDVSVVEVGGGVSEVLATSGDNRLGGTDFDERVAEYLCMCAVEYGRSHGSGVKKTKNTKSDSTNKQNNEEVAGASSIDSDIGIVKIESEKRRIPIVKDWYRQGSGDVPGIILRMAEKVRIRLSNQKMVEVLVPLTEDGWRIIGGGDDGNDAYEPYSPSLLLDSDVIIGPHFDKAMFETERGMVEGIDYIIVSLDRKIFETICSNELQRLLRPLREVAIMARVLLPGEARPSFVENAKAIIMMGKRGDAEEGVGYYEDEDDLWEFTDQPIAIDDNYVENGIAAREERSLDEQAVQQIHAMDIKSQKKAQQRGRKLSRDIDKRERSFRKQKQTAMEDATTASLLGRQLDGGGARRMKFGVAGGSSKVAATSQQSIGLLGNERVQEGIHGRPLSRIILVGGATRMPVISKLLEGVVGIVPQRTVNPDEAVALGCAVQVGILDGVNDGLLGGMQAVLSPMQAAVMRALAKKKEALLGGDGMETRAMVEGRADGLAIVDEFDDEDDFY